MLLGYITCYLPFWPVLAPEPNSILLIQYTSFFDHMLYTNSKVRSTLLNGSEVHEFIFAERLRHWMVGAKAKAFV